MASEKFLSIVTPTYNRSELLKQCYQSLRDQTNQHFEWIIVDDGSTDDTREVVLQFQKQSPNLSIQYVYKENGGKHTALNASHAFIRGDFVLVLDSDDRLTKDAVEMVLLGWQIHDSPAIGAVIFLEGYSEKQPFSIGKKENVPLDMYHNHTKRLIISDCCDIYRSEAFKKFPYPVFEGERFLSESILWDQMADEYQIVYINEVIYIADYLEGGLTKSGRAMRIRMPQGGKYASNMKMRSQYPLKLRLKNGLLYTCYGFFGGDSPLEMIKKSCAPLLAAICMPFGFMLYQYWKKKYM